MSIRNIYFSVFLAFFLLSQAVFAQAGSYYDLIDVNASTFVNDLKSRIRSPYTKISYDNFDETNIANFAAVDNGNGTKSVFCVYSNYEHVYTGTFTWLPLSREHTYAHSWQPTYPSESGNEYSDQHHLFPTHQNSANAVRSNHPLGNVSGVISTFLEATYGTNTNGDNVYEPRDKHKGDAARAMLYMSLRYDGLDGNDWTFEWLNNTRLPSLSEAPQDLATLLEWHKNDPPDKWEVDRNNYIQSIQQNRNPFVDHPEYVYYIDFNDLTKLNPSFAVEPDNYATNFNGTEGASGITLTWTDAVTDAQLPSGYLLLAYDSDDYFIPLDGEVYTTDSDLSDGQALINIPFSDPDTYTFGSLSANTTYYFTMFSYNGSGTSRNYKINETVPSAVVSYQLAGLAAEPTNHAIDFTAGSVTTTSIEMTWTDAVPGTQAPSGYLLIANNTGSFTDPADGTNYADDTNLGDGSARVNIDYVSADAYTFTGLAPATDYYFRLYSYNGSGDQINYKTDGTVPEENTATSASSGGDFAELLFSEYVEGSSNNKAVEIFNGTANAVNLSTGSYKIEIYYNGSTTPQSTINLTGTVQIGDVYVVANSSATSEILNVTDQTSGSLAFNGDDAVILKKGTAVIDAIGQIGVDPGSQWGTGLVSTQDNTLRRKVTVTEGDDNPDDAFDPSIEWDGYDQDTFSGLGSPLPLPVELVSFTGIVNGNNVSLQWLTATEINNYGFEIERNGFGDRTGFEVIGFVSGSGNSNIPINYSFDDSNLKPGEYSYRLKQIDTDGKYEYSDIITAEIANPALYTLDQNYPNPFNPSTTIKFSLPERTVVSLKVFNALGEEVATLVDELKEPGIHESLFNADNLASGIYFYSLRTENFVEFKKMVLLR